MSFILDAVKKSEQERRYSQMEAVQSWYYQPQKPKQKKSYWIGVMVLINTLVLLGLMLWLVQPAWLQQSRQAVVLDEEQALLQPQQADQEPLVAASQDQQAATKTPSVTGAQEDVQPPVDVPIVNEVITPSMPVETIATQEKVPLDIQAIPTLEALPESIMIHVPAIAFSSHLYSSEPTARQVVVNGQKLRQGEYLNRDLQLLEIHEKSVIFQQFQYPFKVLLSRYWARSE